MTMTREELNGKQTPGPVMFSTMEYPCVMCANHPQWNTADISEGLPNGHDETMANGTLYAEAHNVANRTGMWPEDLVARVKELEQALKQAKAMMNEARSLADAGGKWDALHAPGTLEQGIREIDATLNKPTP